ncbi:hypothetical protein JCM16775_p2020 (plasmid) [Leptotrichia hofstadii]|uniref:Uncharacterized protein n=2 Tax=Leptotrichia hofstadii TaxID=157688 RepID=A0A510JN81_9FUSO|nr:hypothetical protein [Leptotrichia hofstadii]BBM39795.1 hypothetical protein JCM16775_p2020 [Leptotrichia hofstadii]
MATVGAKKTIRDLIFKDKRHKDFQESEKINFANKGIVKLILLYTVSSILSVAQRDWQYKRNIEKLILENKTQKIHLIEQLREKSLVENLIIVTLSIIVSLIILYYYNKKMNEVNKGSQKWLSFFVK